MRKISVLAALLITLVSSPNASAQTDAEIEEGVHTEIMDRHPVYNPKWWRNLGASAPAVIMHMYEAESSVYARMRLIEGLGSFSDDAGAVNFIKTQAEKTNEAVVRNNAIRVVGLSQGAKEEDWISKQLKHEDPNTRIAAANALKQIGTSSALAKVERMMAGEKVDWVVAKLKKEAPQPSLLQSATQTSSVRPEDRLSPEWAGTWLGYWVYPQGEPVAGQQSSQNPQSLMKSEATRFTLSLRGDTELTGAVQAGYKTKKRSLALVRTQGKSNHWSGFLSEEVALPGGKSRHDEIACEGDLSQRGSIYLMQVKLPASGAVMLLRRGSVAQ